MSSLLKVLKKVFPKQAAALEKWILGKTTPSAPASKGRPRL
jgi:hypothetical protein